MQIRQSIPTTLLHGHVRIARWQVPKRAIFPIVLVLIAMAGIFSPLFNLNEIHGVPSLRLYTQHIYFDGIADAGGFYAATFCSHWYHKVPIAIGIALLSTLALVTLVG